MHLTITYNQSYSIISFELAGLPGSSTMTGVAREEFWDGGKDHCIYAYIYRKAILLCEKHTFKMHKCVCYSILVQFVLCYKLRNILGTCRC
jgi:hypothetical protein